jgi:amidohydrolase
VRAGRTRGGDETRRARGVLRALAATGLLVGALAGTAAARAPLQALHRPEDDAAVRAWLDEHLPRLIALYERVHAEPELSMAEERTAALVADELGRAGYRVATGIGGTGVVGVLENGPGPTLLVRGDMDALPVTEETGLPYASTVRTTLADGTTTGVMHACGHDVHTAALVGTGALLAALRERWRGTLVLVAQPAEEVGKGARMMIEDGLFERFPRPDACLALHVAHDMPAGQIGYTPGFNAANVDSVDVTIHGRGGHGARPHEAVDPIVTAAHVVVALQTLVSRRIDPTEPAVVTVGAIHAGAKHNVIPDTAVMRLTLRSYSDAVRRELLEGVRQIAADTCRTFGCPRPPEVAEGDEHTPAAYNDPALTAAAAEVFRQVFGAENVVERRAEMGGEDFGRYARALGVPGLMFRLGSVGRETWEASRRPGGPALPAIHSGRFAPAPEPTLRAGVRAMGALVLALLPRR